MLRTNLWTNAIEECIMATYRDENYILNIIRLDSVWTYKRVQTARTESLEIRKILFETSLFTNVFH